MNQNDSHREITAKDEGNFAQIAQRGESKEPDAVDEYMRHVGKTLYEIIRDWVREQKGQTEEINDLEVGEPELTEGGTA